MSEQLLTTPQAAKLLDCCRNHVAKLWETGELAGRQIGKWIFIEAESVRAILNRRRNHIDGQLKALESGAA